MDESTKNVLRKYRYYGLKSALNAIAFLSVKAEKDGDIPRFQAFGDACTAIRHLMDLNETQPLDKI